MTQERPLKYYTVYPPRVREVQPLAPTPHPKQAALDELKQTLEATANLNSRRRLRAEIEELEKEIAAHKREGL